MSRKHQFELVAVLLLVGVCALAGWHHLQAGGEKGQKGEAAKAPPDAANPSPTLPPPPVSSFSLPPPIPSQPATLPIKDILWTFNVDMQGGKTILTARIKNRNVEIQVACDKVDMQVPRGLVQAQGSVKLTSPNLEATSDSLSINLQEDILSLGGRAQVIHRQQGQEVEVRGDRLSLRLTMLAKEEPKSKEESRLPTRAARPARTEETVALKKQ